MDPREPPVTEPRDLRRSVMHQTQYAALVATRAEQLVVSGGGGRGVGRTVSPAARARPVRTHSYGPRLLHAW